MLTVAEFARRAGCLPKQVYRAIDKGLISRTADKLIDAAQLSIPLRKPNRRTIVKREMTTAVVTAYCDVASAWRNDDPCCLGVQIEVAGRVLAAEVEAATGDAPDLSDLDDLADVVMFWDWQVRREEAGWLRLWPAIAAAAIAKELRIPRRAAALQAALERQVLERLTVTMTRDEDELRDPAIEPE